MKVFNHRVPSVIVVLALSAATGLRADDAAAALFGKRCALCHGKDGSGDTPAGRTLKARDLRSAEVQKQKDAELAAFIANGKPGKMAAFKDSIPANEIAALVAHIRGMKKH